MDYSALANAEMLGQGFIRLPDAQRVALKLPLLTAALKNYCHVEDSFSPLGNIMRIIFGKRANTGTTTLTLPTFVCDNSSSIGTASKALCAFVAGDYVSILGAKPSIRINPVGSGGTITTPVMSLGTTAAATASATLLTTEANIFPSTAVTSLTATVAGTFTSAGTVAITDSTSGTVSRTIPALTAVSNSATDISGIVTWANNTAATIAALLNPLIPGAGGLATGDGAAAVTVYLNFACNSDPGSGKILNIGDLATPMSDTTSHVDIFYRTRTPVLSVHHDSL